MLHCIPGNRLEILVEPLKQLLATPSPNVLTTDWILVPHRGMQHWLSMELATDSQRQICMNLNMMLPASGIWKLVHLLLEGDSASVSTESWRRENLSWRIFQVLADPELVDLALMREPTDYWRSGAQETQNLKRFQLAEQLADLFEQYLIYRPDWIQQWQTYPETHWQSLIWHQLSNVAGHHPLDLLELAEKNMMSGDSSDFRLPQRVFLFSINNLAPLWLDFLKQLSDKAGIDIHLLYLNPSDEYWADQVSERQAARLRARWFENTGTKDDVEPEMLVLETGNELLSSLGHQGQAFVHLLSDVADIETPVFVHPGSDNLLQRLQSNILQLTNENVSDLAPPDYSVDDSIQISSSYSALREVQALHDWLLNQFNKQPELKPRDILVMCPEIEKYAPYIEAVFAHGFDKLSERQPPLPCSIADRSLVSSDPLVATFLSFLELPDSRLSVSQILGWLNIPVIQQYFGFTRDSLIKIENWLEQAHIHWGLNAQHKRELLKSSSASQRFTWELGLNRLLLGFAWGDEIDLVGNDVMLPPVEGADAILLGQLIGFIKQLEQLGKKISAPHTPLKWVSFLKQDVLETLFSGEKQQRSYQQIEHCLDTFLERIQIAGQELFNSEIDSGIMRYFLKQELSRPENTSNQYLMGQVTFCSLIPMRSVPFKVVAVLGLNDGEFPRQRQPVGFDLMAKEPARKGDRSRRGDDRYLFLETLLSARDHLYLSYQGKNIHNNSERQPSLLLEELMSYLETYLGWNRQTALLRQPMQAFSPKNYLEDNPSFDPVGFRLLSQSDLRDKSSIQIEIGTTRATTQTLDQQVINVEQLVRFFDSPAKYFAEQQLGLYLNDEEQQISDIEPFEANFLQRYNLQQQLVLQSNEVQLLDIQPDHIDSPITRSLKLANLTGEFPEAHWFDDQLAEWQQQSSEFYASLQGKYDFGLLTQKVEVNLGDLVVQADLPLNSSSVLQYWRLANLKPKDMLRIWLNQLVAQLALPDAIQSTGFYRGKSGVAELNLPHINDADEILTRWIDQFQRGQSQPLLLNAGIGLKLNQQTNPSLAAIWHSQSYVKGLDQDPYLNYFWPQIPNQDLADQCMVFYQAMNEGFVLDGKGVKL